MNLTDILTKETIEVNVDLKNKKQLITEIAVIACKHPAMKGIAPSEVEKLLSFAVGIITTRKGIDFNSIDNEKVNIFPFVIGPEDNPKEHLKVLSGMARLLRNPETRSTIRKAVSPQELYDFLEGILQSSTSSTETKQLGPAMRMLHVFIRDEDLFNDVLQVFASDDLTGAMVLEAHESTEYMSNMPVFAGLWNNDLNTFNRIIMAVVKESLLNQTLRNIEYVCGDFRKQTDVMVTVTDLHHALGSLEF
ncbi:MAG: hypothetical protein B1H09_01670 [Gemmatimonadaceae bacterium 4484_173]|nr:MAG: hypothetical protein B1H09_01670 [Gemmatimonadaceae bacterium 4484_173]